MQEYETHDARAPMMAAPMRYREDGSVDWGNMWDSFCVLAQEGGPPHRAKMLRPPDNADPTSEGYRRAAAELCRGIQLVSELATAPAEPGWLAVSCHSEGMARWLSEAIVSENVAARAKGHVLYVPVGEEFELKGEIKSVITAVAKTTHYWRLHVPAEVKQTLAAQAWLSGVWQRLRAFLGRRTAPTILLLIALLLALSPRPASAHPLGNFSINRYSRLHLSTESADLFYVVDLAEIPTLQEIKRADTSGDGIVDEAEGNAYLEALLTKLGAALHLTVDGQSAPLQIMDSTLTFPPGESDLPTMRLEVMWHADLPATDAPRTGVFRDDSYADRYGWQEVIVQAGEGIQILDSSVPASDLSDALRRYPEGLEQLPAVNEATFHFSAAPVAAPAAAARVPNTPPAPSQAADPLSTEPAPLLNEPALWAGEIANRFGEPSQLLEPGIRQSGGLAATLLLAVILGAGHALSPGHGKAIVGAYLVGTRGTAYHALFLGLVTTVTHTAGVFALGFLTLFASRYILPERLFPWLSALSGMMVFLIGAAMIRSQWRRRTLSPDEPGLHTHLGITHSHLPQSSESGVRWSNLLALGVSGGLIPCPSALLLLLGAIALQRTAFGLILVTAFSVGLAGVLTAVGLVLVYAGRLFERTPLHRSRLVRVIPVGSAAFITLIGLAMTVRSLLDAGLLR